MINPSGNGWLASCEPCRWEFYSTRRPTADKAAHEHRKTNHKENQ
ncbi:hypothetical protein [Arthrobacter sp. Alg241-R88]|nr:hypothetical protein [Arthrobacter sp. Alg241-R88]